MSLKVKQAILLAAGFGTRLRPLTDTIPKCLVPINGKPLLYIWLESLANVGVSKFLINTHYLPEKVTEAIETHPLRSCVELIYEPELLGTASTVKALLKSGQCQLEDTLIAHADNLCFCNWQGFIEAHFQRKPNTLGTLMSFETDSPESCGILELDQGSVLVGFHEKVTNPPGYLANAAIYLCSIPLLTMFSDVSDKGSDISCDIIPQLLGKITVWENSVYLRDIGTPQAYSLAQKEYEVLLVNRQH